MVGCGIGSRDEHAVAVAEEAVFLLDGMAVGGENLLAPGEGADQHQQARLRQMKVGEQRADQRNSKPGEIKISVAPEWGLMGRLSARERGGFKRAHDCGADGHDAAAFRDGAIDGSAASAPIV